MIDGQQQSARAIIEVNLRKYCTRRIQRMLVPQLGVAPGEPGRPHPKSDKSVSDGGLNLGSSVAVTRLGVYSYLISGAV